MKVYKIKAKNFYNDAHLGIVEVNEDSLYIVQELRKEFTIWEDHFGEYDCEDPIYAGLNDCKSLEEARKTLLDKDLISEDAQFVDIE